MTSKCSCNQCRGLGAFRSEPRRRARFSLLVRLLAPLMALVQQP